MGGHPITGKGRDYLWERWTRPDGTLLMTSYTGYSLTSHLEKLDRILLGKPTLLILCHLHTDFEHLWDDGYPARVINAAAKYDKVIHLSATGLYDEDYSDFFVDQNWQIVEFDWGYEPECYDQNPEQVYAVETLEESLAVDGFLPANGHEFTRIPEEFRYPGWMRAYDVHLGGGADYECLQDVRDILDLLEVEYTDERELIYG